MRKVERMMLNMVNDLNDYSSKLSILSNDLLESTKSSSIPCELTCPKADQCIRLGEGCINV
jgi:hypothetical protein